MDVRTTDVAEAETAPTVIDDHAGDASGGDAGVGAGEHSGAAPVAVHRSRRNRIRRWGSACAGMLSGKLMLPLVSVLLVVAAACVVFFGIRAHSVYTSDKPIAAARDDATDAAQQAMLNVTTIDSKDLASFDKRLRSSFTGDALSQVQSEVTSSLTPRIKQAGTQAGGTTSRVLSASPVQVDADGGKAQVLVYLAVRGVDPKGQPGDPNTMGFLVDMTRTGGSWMAAKVTAMDGIDLDGGSSGNAPTDEPAPATASPATGGN